MEATSASSSHQLIEKMLSSINDVAEGATQACEALKTVEGYLEQLKRAGDTLEIVPDYSLDFMPV